MLDMILSEQPELMATGAQVIEFENVKKFENLSIATVVPTRGLVCAEAAASWVKLQYPMNHKRMGPVIVRGHAVDDAYETAIGIIIEKHPEYAYILTLEDDCLIPTMGVLKLLKTLREGNFDAVSGAYIRKEPGGKAHIYGDPNDLTDWGIKDFKKGEVIECNGIPMGMTLYRRECFEGIERPWFKNEHEMIEGSVRRYSQDLYFCKKAREAGKRFAVDCSVVVGHVDSNTGVTYFPAGAGIGKIMTKDGIKDPEVLNELGIDCIGTPNA